MVWECVYIFFTVETLQDVLKEIDEKFKKAENDAAVGSDDMSDVMSNKDDSATPSVEVIMISDDETEDTSDSVFDSPPYSPKYGPDCNVFYSPASPTDPSE